MDIGFLLLAGSLPVAARRRPLGRSMLLSSLFVRSLPSARRRFRWCCCDNPVIQNQFGRSPVLILNSLDWLSITTSLHLLLSSPSIHPASVQHSSLASGRAQHQQEAMQNTLLWSFWAMFTKSQNISTELFANYLPCPYLMYPPAILCVGKCE